ncbi:MAG: isoprenylcysteine carboxylmethyltransferase family protein [Bacteroidia bacterium]|nr:isoprenylcysteine carboxylmethyltransferase family protein [Bacteroidia bacterium]
MKNVIKQLISLILPITVLVFVPLYIETNISIPHLSVLLTGLFIMCIGLYIMTMTISTFIRIGKGTLAPWSPTRKLVIGGMYGHVRNPMIMGVLIVLIGESIAVLSLNIFIWAGIFFIINNLFFVLYEEPNLEKRFGTEYQEYKKNVPRWIPSLKAFVPDSELK